MLSGKGNTMLASTTTATPAAPDYAAIKQRQQATWATGDYAVIGTTLQIVGERLCEAIDLRADERVLDVAAGNGNATLAAARQFAQVTSTDYVGALLDRGKLLKLEVASQRGAGQLTTVTTIQRLNTKGGVADGPCDAAGAFLSVPYSADYTFLKKGR